MKKNNFQKLLMKKFITYIKELFDTKSYEWVKKEGFRKIAKFQSDKKTYYIHFDEIMPNVYNLYFFYNDEYNIPDFNLIKNSDSSVFKILANVKNSVIDFIDNDPYIDFIGFSSTENERNQLYMLFLQNISNKDFSYSFKDMGEKTYFFLFKKGTSELLRNRYINKLIENDKKK